MNLELSLEKKFPAFQFKADVSAKGKRLGVFGPSGSGKSTLMNLLAGLITPDRGFIRLDGHTLFDSEKRILVSPKNRRIGVVFQHAHLFPHMNVQRNLMYGFKRTPEKERKISPGALIDVLALGHLLDRSVHRLSGGERQRVALGRTLLASPRLILMDEPLTGLDQHLKYQIIPYLKRVFQEFDIPLIFISHSLREMRLLTDDVLVFDKGFLSHCLSSEDLARHNLVSGDRAYANLITLKNPLPHKDLWRYTWGNTDLILTEPGKEGENIFELPSKDITLFKRHPEASSARNLLHGIVTDFFNVGNRVGVELSCSGEKLICQIVPESVEELDIRKGEALVAAIKASAFRKLF
ncbi:MAG: molybdenum ABC transporter ATP-binding protein [Proteobacteria bacterium]|nr:molybdenum ABC transporter ATP-binding protein [Pseudomonadota bacterium]